MALKILRYNNYAFDKQLKRCLQTWTSVNAVGCGRGGGCSTLETTGSRPVLTLLETCWAPPGPSPTGTRRGHVDTEAGSRIPQGRGPPGRSRELAPSSLGLTQNRLPPLTALRPAPCTVSGPGHRTGRAGASRGHRLCRCQLLNPCKFLRDVRL